MQPQLARQLQQPSPGREPGSCDVPVARPMQGRRPAASVSRPRRPPDSFSPCVDNELWRPIRQVPIVLSFVDVSFPPSEGGGVRFRKQLRTLNAPGGHSQGGLLSRSSRPDWTQESARPHRINDLARRSFYCYGCLFSTCILELVSSCGNPANRASPPRLSASIISTGFTRHPVASTAMLQRR